MDLFQIIIIIILLLLVIIMGVYLISTKGLKNTIKDAILYAEKQYNTTSGKERLSIAINYVYDFLPHFIKTFLPQSFIEHLVQKFFDETKELLDYQKEDDVNDKMDK